MDRKCSAIVQITRIEGRGEQGISLSDYFRNIEPKDAIYVNMRCICLKSATIDEGGHAPHHHDKFQRTVNYVVWIVFEILDAIEGTLHLFRAKFQCTITKQSFPFQLSMVT